MFVCVDTENPIGKILEKAGKGLEKTPFLGVGKGSQTAPFCGVFKFHKLVRRFVAQQRLAAVQPEVHHTFSPALAGFFFFKVKMEVPGPEYRREEPQQGQGVFRHLIIIAQAGVAAALVEAQETSFPAVFKNHFNHRAVLALPDFGNRAVAPVIVVDPVAYLPLTVRGTDGFVLYAVYPA